MSSNFPELPEPQIPRDNLIAWIKDLYTPSRRAIVVDGPAGSGKTTLLAQFTLSEPQRCLCFFLAPTCKTSRPRDLMLDLSEQMALVLGRDSSGLDRLDTDQLEQTYWDLYRQFARFARQTGGTHYIVLDGFEWVREGGQEERIVSLIPDPRPSIAVLLGASPATQFPFAVHRWNMPLFSRTDTERYLAGLVNDEQAQYIHTVSGGMPGYLAEVRRLLQSTTDTEGLIARLPKELEQVLGIEWERITTLDEQDLVALAVIAYSPTSLTLDAAAVLLQSEPSDLRRRLLALPIMRTSDTSGELGFISHAHQQFAAKRLIPYRERAVELMVTHFRQDPLSRASLNSLPILLAQAGRYDQLEALISTDYLSSALQRTGDIVLLRRTLELMSRLALDAGRQDAITGYTLASSVLRTLSMRPVAESEIDVLMALGEYDQAHELAHQALLLEDRLQLLTRVYRKRLQEGLAAPRDVLLELEQMADALDARALRDRALGIAAGLFDLLPEVAIRLAGRTTGGTPERPLDSMRVELSLQLEEEAQAEHVEVTHAETVDEAVRDFTNATSLLTGQLAAAEAVAMADRVQDTSAKLQILSAWCNRNRANPDALAVIQAALTAISADPDYEVPIRLLRQIADPLKHCSGPAVGDLVQRIDLLKSTAVRSPAEEATRLELALAAVEHNQDDAVPQRLQEAYTSLVQIPELDVRCYCLAHLLVSLPDVDPLDSLGLLVMADTQLRADYRALLDHAADHWAVTRRLLVPLVSHDPKLALELAGQLNLQFRRDEAFRGILWAYPARAGKQSDVHLVLEILDRISEAERRDIALIGVIERFSDLGVLGSLKHLDDLLARIPVVRAAYNRGFAYAHAIRGLPTESDRPLRDQLAARMEVDIQAVDATWERADLSLALAAITAKADQGGARRLVDSARHLREADPLAERHFADIYVTLLRLGIRVFAGIMDREPSDPARRDRLIGHIHGLPSLAAQCGLFSDLSLRYRLRGRPQDADAIISEEVVPLLDQCQDPGDRAELLMDVAPALYEYDAGTALRLLETLSPSIRDHAFYCVATYLIAKRPPGDPVDLDAVRARTDIRDANRVCDVIEQMRSDSAIYHALSAFVKSLIQPDQYGGRRDTCPSLVERNALEIADRLEKAAVAALPDQQNIQHQGFLVAARACCARLRAAARSRSRADEPWQAICDAARAIPNAADRSLVLAWCAENMYRSDATTARSILQEAQDTIQAIPDILDRADRVYQVASSWASLNEDDPSRPLLHEAMRLLQLCPYQQSRDQITGKVMDLAHSVDPSLASSLTPLIDSPLRRHVAELGIVATELHQNPHNVSRHEGRDREELQYLLGRAAWRMHRSLNSGRGTIRGPKEVGQWLERMADGNLRDVGPVVAWAIEDLLQHTRQTSIPVAMCDSVFDSLDLCRCAGQVLAGIRAGTRQLRDLSLPMNVRLLGAGRRAEAVEALRRWLDDHADGYVKVHDPYFCPGDLEHFGGIDQETEVYIVTSWAGQKGFGPDTPGIEDAYRNAWRALFDHTPPSITITILGTKTGSPPIHDRWIITRGAGLSLGTSLSGLGNRDSGLHFLEADEAARIEAELIDPWLGAQPRLHKGERVTRRWITL